MWDPEETCDVQGCESNLPAVGDPMLDLREREPLQIIWLRVRDHFLGSMVSGV